MLTGERGEGKVAKKSGEATGESGEGYWGNRDHQEDRRGYWRERGRDLKENLILRRSKGRTGKIRGGQESERDEARYPKSGEISRGVTITRVITQAKREGKSKQRVIKEAGEIMGSVRSARGGENAIVRNYLANSQRWEAKMRQRRRM